MVIVDWHPTEAGRSVEDSSGRTIITTLMTDNDETGQRIVPSYHLTPVGKVRAVGEVGR